jgi:hypothetical protein
MPANGILTVVSGSQTVTGGFSTIYALVDSDITISGSEVGVARFVMPKGMTFEATVEASVYQIDNHIASISVHNTYGKVLAVTSRTA